MVMLRFLMFALMAVGVAFVVSQMLLPAINNTPLFPLFRSKLRQAESDLEDKQTSKAIREIEADTIRIELAIEEAFDDLLEENKKEKL